MQTITTKAMAKVAAVATGLAMATSILSLAPIAHAATFSTNLTVGSSGADVTALQQALIANGYSIPAGATGHFGPQTKAAVMAWQKAAGVSPAAGYFGPISRAAFNLGGTGTTGTTGSTSTVAGCAPGAMFSSTTGQACTTTTTVAGCAPGAMFSSTTGASCTGGTTTTGGALTGVGRLTSITSLGDVTSGIHAGDPITPVVGVSVQATGGDVAVQRIDATFTICGTGSQTPGSVAVCNGTIGASANTVQSVNLNRYVSDVSLWQGSTKLADVDPSTGTQTGRVWSYRFSGLNAVVKQGTVANFHVEVTPLTAIGTNENGASVVASLLANSVRAVGADGISDTYVSTEVDQAFTVSTPTVGTLTVSPASDNPNASMIAVASSTTTGVKLLSFNMKATNSNIKVTDLVASFGETGTTNLSDAVNTVYLMQGSTVLQSKTLGAGSYNTVTFAGVNQTIPVGSTQNYTIVVDLKGDAIYPDGTTVVASTTVTGWNVSDANGSTVTPSAAAVGNAQTLSANGFTVALNGSPTATVATAGYSGGLDIGTFTIPFTVTTGNTALWIGGASTMFPAGTAPSGSNKGVAYATTTASTGGTTSQPTASVTSTSAAYGSNSLDANNNFYIAPNSTRSFAITMPISASSSDTVGVGNAVQVAITGINYSTTNTMGSLYYTSNLTSFTTPIAYVAKH